MNELALYEDVKTLTPEELGGEIRLLTRQAKTMVLDYGIQIGYRLYVAKEKVENFVEWVERETEFSKSSAYRFIQLYTEYGSGQGSLLGVENSFPTLGKLSISNALRLLAIPEEEREKFAEEVDAEHISARELDAAIAARKEAEDAAGSLRTELGCTKEDLKAAEEERDKLAEELREIKARPIEVAVQEPDPDAIEDAAKKAADDAVKKAKAEHEKQVEKLKKEAAAAAKKLTELEAQKNDLVKKLQEPGKEAELKEALKAAAAEADLLRKKLVAADSGAGEAAIYCKTAQENFMAALDKITAMRPNHPETALKLLRGLYKIADTMTDMAADVAENWGEKLDK